MNKLALAACAAVALISSSASAATYITWTPPAADGSFTATYGNTGVPGGEFDDVFDFTLPTGVTSFTITSTFTDNPENDIDFTTVAYNGNAFNVGATGQNEFRFLNGIAMVNGGQQRLEVSGISGGNGSYSGVISFNPTAAVPEPGAWALMIMGFGGAGAMIRRRHARVQVA